MEIWYFLFEFTKYVIFISEEYLEQSTLIRFQILAPNDLLLPMNLKLSSVSK